MAAHDRRSPRGFMRHPSDIPIEVVSDPKHRPASKPHDVSHGGLSYQAGEPPRSRRKTLLINPADQPC
jgi:hypothetical protein